MSTAAAQAAARERKKQLEEEERAVAATLQKEKEEAEKHEREEKKKARDEERKQEEAEEKAKQDREAAEAAKRKVAEVAAARESNMDTGSDVEEDTMMHLNDMNPSGGSNSNEVTPNVGLFDSSNDDDDQSESRSPRKKKKQKDKKKKKKKDETKQPDVALVLKTGNYTSGVLAKQMKKEAEARERAAKVREKAEKKEKDEEERKKKRDQYMHEHRRNVVECSFVCTKEEEQLRYNDLPSNIRLLLKNMQKVDKMVCMEPVVAGEAEKIWEPTLVPYDHTDLGDYIGQGGGVKAFELRSLGSMKKMMMKRRS